MKYVIAILLVAFGAAAGWGVAFYQQHWGEVVVDSSREVAYYRNPMDASITSPEPRKDHMGMNYIPVYADAKGAEEPGVVSIHPTTLQNMNVRIEQVEQGDLQRQVRTVGFIDYDERAISHVHLRTEGWIEDLQVRTIGERVEAGQVLFRLYSPTLVNAQEELLQVIRRSGNAAPARERLRALGMQAGDIGALERRGEVSQLMPVRARQGGIVQQLNVREGMQMSPAQAVMSIADLSRVWVLAELFEHQVAGVSVGSQAEVALASRPGDVIQSTVDYIYPSLNTPTRTVQVRLLLNNPDGTLRPGMYGDVLLDTAVLSDVVHVPAEAVIRTGRQSRVVMALGEGRFEGREVRVGRRAGDRLEILEGLDRGERIVSSSHFLIDSESSVSANMQRMAAADSGMADDAAPEVWTKAEVTSLDAGERTLELRHEPIPEFGWPAMTMGFSVAEGLDLDAIEPGMQARFRVIEGGDLGYSVTAIESSHESGSHSHD